jgi:hypothetical protein
MANPIAAAFRKYPTVLWLGTGVFAYVWKLSMVSTVYNRDFATFEKQRLEELRRAR